MLGLPLAREEERASGVPAIRGDDIVLYLYYLSAEHRVRVTARPSGRFGRLPDELAPTTRHVTVNPQRPIEHLARDVERRLLRPMRAEVEEASAHLRIAEETERTLRAVVGRLRAQFPTVQFRVDRNGQFARVYASGDGHSLTGVLWPEGKLTIHRVHLGDGEKATVRFLRGLFTFKTLNTG